MKSLFRLTRFPYEEPYHLNLRLDASNGEQATTFEYYANATDLTKLGDALSNFSGNDRQEHLYEIGSESPEDRWAYYLRLRTFLITSRGESGIEIRVNNNEKPPDRSVAEFTIRTEIASINRLGDLLTKFGQLNHRVLEWDGSDGVLQEPGQNK